MKHIAGIEKSRSKKWLEIALFVFIFTSFTLVFVNNNPSINYFGKSVNHHVRSIIYVDQNRLISSAVDQYKPAPVMASGPLRVNTMNPRYFTDGNGKTVYLAGSHIWNNLQDSGSASNLPYQLDYGRWLDFLQTYNHNFFQLWVWGQTKWVAESSIPYYFVPMPYQRVGPELALDGLPKFDLTQFDQSFFDRMRSRIIEAGDRGIYVSIILFNGWSTDNKANWGGGQSYPWDGHPFNLQNNINSINGDPNGDNLGVEIENLSMPAVTNLQDAYVRKVVDTVNDLDNILYEICVECSEGSTDWQYHMVNLIRSYQQGKPQQHPVGISQITFDDGLLFASNADWVSIHDSGSLDSPYVAGGAKVVVVDTDHVCGICGDRKWVWKTFMNGKNPQFMDQYDDSYKWLGGGYDLNNPNDVSLRKNLGYTINYASRINLSAMIPRPDLSSTGYCLANPVITGAEYLVYSPNGGSFNINLSGSPGPLNIEWFNPENGTVAGSGTVMGGAARAFTVPFSGDAVLYIYATVPATQTPTPTRTKTSLPPIFTKTNTPSGPTGTRTNTPTIPTASRTNTPIPPTVTRTNTSIVSSVTRTNTPSGPTAPWIPTTTSTLNFSTLTPTSPLTFPTLTFTLPVESSLTPSVTGTVPATAAVSTSTGTPIPPGSNPARTLLYCVVGILLSAAIVGVLFYLLWIFRQLNRPG
jgi:hypothetical protein